jgi:hypothetical protein
VPYVISTDDAGVTRHTLSNEYVLFASRYKPGYAELKKTSYNSIRYAFLQGRRQGAPDAPARCTFCALRSRCRRARPHHREALSAPSFQRYFTKGPAPQGCRPFLSSGAGPARFVEKT